MPRLERKHSLATRLFHWVNAPVLAVMIWSGLLIYWAYDPYEIKWRGRVVFHFFPDWLYNASYLPTFLPAWFRGQFSMAGRLAEGMSWHFAFMWLFAINGLLYVSYTFASGEWRHLIPNRRTFAEAIQVVLHDLHVRKAPLPRRKFNGAQRIAYTGVVSMGAASLLTGLAIYKPVQVGWLTWMLGGYEWARLEHFTLTLLYVFFFFIHIAQVIKSGWNNARAMIIGVELTPDGEPSYEEADFVQAR